MLKSCRWAPNRSYRSGTAHEPLEFYLTALASSRRFDLLLGYFSSSAINVLSLGFAKFLHGGGTMRVVANNIFSQEDKEAIEQGLGGKLPDDVLDLSDIRSLKARLDEHGRHFFECLAWLIAQRRIQFVIVKPKGRSGIAHFKSGVFSDGVNEVGFKASCNFTAYGMLENLEELDAFLSWEDGRSQAWLRDQEVYFDEIHSGASELVDYVSIEEVEVAIRSEFGSKDLNELLVQEQELLSKRVRMGATPGLKRVAAQLENELDEIASQPRFPYSSGPRPYQKEAYQNWLTNNRQGVFAMATGTGKTITSLNCLLEESRKAPEGVYHALILVPTITLVNQWEQEARSFNFQEVIKVSSKTEWQRILATTLSTAKRVPTSFIIISTYASFKLDRFNEYMAQLPSDTILIADEAHNIGSRSVMNRLGTLGVEKRIALSATPKRIYDPEGTTAMEAFFSDREPYVYAFPMERAIAEGILCHYDYHPHIVNLTSAELEEYVTISIKLSRLFNSNTGSYTNEDLAQMLLMKRKRIIHKAFNKLSLTRRILEERFRREGNLRYTFIYVPEGITTEPSDDDTDVERADNIRLIHQYTREVGRIDPSILVNQFVSGMPDRDDVLNQFKVGRIQVIASMKCLDEGVDIPRAEHAIFCSSTGNPRQFIQRRGRILRKHPDKFKAVIHDLIVLPELSLSTPQSDTFALERNLVKKELERVMYFASLSNNPLETEELFMSVCQHYDLNIYTIHRELQTT